MSKKKSSSISYDPGIILQFAGELYRQAKGIVALYTLIGIAGGLFLGIPLMAFVGLFGFPAGAALFGLMGFAVGRQKSFSLRLEAQRALCQLQTEVNTRRE